MAVDKLVDSTALNSDLTSVANAIRTKGGTSSPLAFPAGFVSAISNIPTGGGSTPALGTKTITANGTYAASSDSLDGYSEVTVNVPTGGGGSGQKATGTYIPDQTYNTNGSRQITTIADIGFTPTLFRLYVSNRSNVYGTTGAMLYSYYSIDKANNTLLTTLRFSNGTGGIGANNNSSDWTTQTNGYLYLNNGIVYMRTASNAALISDIEYTWEAYA